MNDPVEQQKRGCRKQPRFLMKNGKRIVLLSVISAEFAVDLDKKRVKEFDCFSALQQRIFPGLAKLWEKPYNLLARSACCGCAGKECKLLKQFSYVLTRSVAPHAGLTGRLLKEAARFTSRINLLAEGRCAVMDKLADIQKMNLSCGKKITVTIEGRDEEAAVAAIQNYVVTNF